MSTSAVKLLKTGLITGLIAAILCLVGFIIGAWSLWPAINKEFIHTDSGIIRFFLGFFCGCIGAGIVGWILAMIIVPLAGVFGYKKTKKLRDTIAKGFREGESTTDEDELFTRRK